MKMDEILRAVLSIWSDLPDLAGPAWETTRLQIKTVLERIQGTDRAEARGELAAELLMLVLQVPSARRSMLAALREEIVPEARSAAGGNALRFLHHDLHAGYTLESWNPEINPPDRTDDALEALLALAARPRRAPPPPGADPDPRLYVNAWFPDHPTATLTVDVPAAFRVNIGPLLTAAGHAEPLPAAASALLVGVGHVDVLVLARDARVVPLRRRLHLPPGPDATVEFAVTPRMRGASHLAVVLLVQNDPIHRLRVPFTVLPLADAAATQERTLE